MEINVRLFKNANFAAACVSEPPEKANKLHQLLDGLDCLPPNVISHKWTWTEPKTWSVATFLRSVPAGSGADVSDVDPGLGHSGAVCPAAEGLRLPLLPPQHPPRPLIPHGSGRRLLLPAGRPAVHPRRSDRSGDTAGKTRHDSWTSHVWCLTVSRQGYHWTEDGDCIRDKNHSWLNVFRSCLNVRFKDREPSFLIFRLQN